jgi:hypothetical protein
MRAPTAKWSRASSSLATQRTGADLTRSEGAGARETGSCAWRKEMNALLRANTYDWDLPDDQP